MNGQMVASLKLTLQDDLTAGLNGLKNILSGLRDAGRGLTLGKLGESGAANALRTISHEALGLVGHLKAIVTNADGAHAALSRIKTAVGGWASRTFGPESRIGALGAAAQGFSVFEPMQNYAEYQAQALRAAMIEGFSGSAANTEAARLMTVFAHEATATAQFSSSIAETQIDLLRTGMSQAQVAQWLPVHSRAATAFGVDPAILSPATYALATSFGIQGDEQEKGALAALALAAQSGRFGVGDFARELPGIAGLFSGWHMTGRGNEDLALASLETVMKYAPDPGSGAADFSDLLTFLGSRTAARSLALEGRGMAPATKQMLEQYHVTGINLPDILAGARKSGSNPLLAVLDAVQNEVRNLPPDVRMQVLGAFFGNQQSALGARALMDHRADLTALTGRLDATGGNYLDAQFNTAMGSPKKKLDLAQERLTQLVRQAGEGFLPVLSGVNWGLSHFLGLLDRLDGTLPGVKSEFLGLVGWTLALGTALGTIGFVWPAVAAGANLVWGALRLGWSALRGAWTGINFVVDALAGVLGVSTAVAAAIVAGVVLIAAAAYDIYKNWGRFRGFFVEMWHGVEGAFNGFVEFLTGVFTLNLRQAFTGWQKTWDGIGRIIEGALGVVKQLFIDLFKLLDSWTGGAILSTLHAIGDAVGGIINKIHEWIELLKNSAVGRLLGVNDKPAPAGGGAQTPGPAGISGMDPSGGAWLLPQMPQGKVAVEVGVDPNARPIITKVQSNSPSVQAKAAPNVNPGPTLGRD